MGRVLYCSVINMEASNPSFVKKIIRSKTISESSEMSVGAESLPEMDVDMSSIRNRSGSVNSREAVTSEAKLENFLYDKYLANFFNPLHAKPTGEGLAPEAKAKSFLYDVDGKFAYSTYSEEMRSYHPMLDIKALKKDLK